MPGLEEAVIIEVVAEELRKEGVGLIQSERIGKVVAKVLLQLNGRYTTTDRHI